MQLQPCAGCRRHVVAAERVCPFCGASISAAPTRARPILGKVSRAAIFGVGASAAAACWTSSTPATTSSGGGTLSNKGTGQATDDGAPAPPTGMAAIYGVCTDSGTGQPLENVRIQIHPEASGEAVTTKTDARGRYVANVPPGRYGIQYWGPKSGPRGAPSQQYVDLQAGQVERLDVPVENYDMSNVPMPYGAPPQRRRVV